MFFFIPLKRNQLQNSQQWNKPSSQHQIYKTLKFVESPKNVWFSGLSLHSVWDNVLPVGISSFTNYSKTEGSTKKIWMIWNCLTSILFNLKVKLLKINTCCSFGVSKNQAMPFFTSKFTQLYVYVTSCSNLHQNFSFFM